MRNPDDFDEFYKNSRDRLLLQTYALTGDLRASRSAVRDAFVLAWHHWRKVNRQPDREAWLRPHAWTDARRRHSARIRHRDRSLDPEIKDILDALGKLPAQQRRILVLTQFSSTAMPEIAREVGLTLEDAGRLLQVATSSYAVQRGTASTSIRAELSSLASATGGARLPRASIIRRAGAARRRAFTGVGIAASVVGLLGAGTFVTDNSGVAPSLTEDSVSVPPSRPVVTITLDSEQLLTTDQVGRLAEGSWTAVAGAPNTAGDGLNTPCQGDRFADPAGLGSMVRRYDEKATGKQPAMTAVQSTELSRTPRTAASTYATTLNWYANCATPGVQLLTAYDVSGVGDKANLLVLRKTGSGSTSTYTVAVARTGHLTTTVFAGRSTKSTPSIRPLTTLLSAAVNRLCGQPGAGTCAGAPEAHRATPPPVGETPGMLEVIDLAPPGRITRPWTATEARRATLNLATVACDGTTFHKSPVTHDMTRSYLILHAGLVARFGITETVGTLPTSGDARRFLQGVRNRMGKCEDNFLASKVNTLVHRTGHETEIAAWHITTEVSDQGAVEVLMAIVRRGPQVGQIGFVTARNASYDRRTFLALAQRAIERLGYLPPPKKG